MRNLKLQKLSGSLFSYIYIYHLKNVWVLTFCLPFQQHKGAWDKPFYLQLFYLGSQEYKLV